MAIQKGLVKSYAQNVYIDGNRTFSTILPDYVDPVKLYAATGIAAGVNYPVGFPGYTLLQIEAAFSEGRVTETEYNDTIAYLQS